MYFKAYSEPMAYSGIFRTVDIFSQFQTLLKSIHAYSEPYLSKLRPILNSGLYRHAIFHAYSSIFTKLHISGHICPNWDSDISRILALPFQIM